MSGRFTLANKTKSFTRRISTTIGISLSSNSSSINHTSAKGESIHHEAVGDSYFTIPPPRNYYDNEGDGLGIGINEVTEATTPTYDHTTPGRPRAKSTVLETAIGGERRAKRKPVPRLRGLVAGMEGLDMDQTHAL
ncbi:hypothetical protein P7C73_g2922, partial [Tremellales sp. Uapishka_1]